MNITHLTSSTFFGGPERQMLGLAEHLRPRIETSFLSFSEGGRCEAFLHEVRQKEFIGKSLQYDTPWLRAATRELTGSLARLKTEVLFCHGYKGGLLGRIAARRLQIPVIAVSRGWTAETWKVRIYEWLDRINLRWMDGVVCVSEAQASKVMRAGVAQERICVIPNSIDVSRFAQPSLEGREKLHKLFRSSPKMILGAAGRLSPEKGFDLFIETAIELSSKDASLGFIHFGDGPLRDELSEKIQQANLQDRVILAGFRDDLDDILPHLDMFVLPSYTEGMPNVILEAQAAGVPVVATAVGGTPEVVIDGETGRLVNAGDQQGLTEAVAALLKDVEQREHFSIQGKERVQSNFTFSAQAQAYAQLLPACEADLQSAF